MSNDPRPPYQKHPAVEIAQMILQFLTLVLTLYVANMSNSNQEKIDQVGKKQETAAQRQEEVKQNLEIKSDKQDQATEIQLWSAWKYLESIAEASGSSVDTAKAAEARKTYEEYVKNNKTKK